MSFAELDPHLFVPRVFLLARHLLHSYCGWIVGGQHPVKSHDGSSLSLESQLVQDFFHLFTHIFCFFWTSHVRSCDAGPAGAGSAAFNLFCISAVCVSAIKDKEACLRNVAGEGNPRWWDSFLPKKSGGYSSYPIFKLEMGEVTWS